MHHTILTVIADSVVRANLTYTLTQSGFNIVTVDDPSTVVDRIRRHFASVVIASLPEPRLLELCREIRRDSDMPIMLQLPEWREQYEWMCFQAGANDVVTATTSKRIMLARVELLVRQHEASGHRQSQTMQVGSLIMDLEARLLYVNGRTVTLTRIEFDLLAQLMAQPRRVHVRGDLVQSVWGEYQPAHVLETHLCRLRKKIRAAGGPAVGEAVRGVGYRLGLDAGIEALVS